MILTELYLKNFGRFTDKKITLKEGINLFYGENGKGKSTLHMFIRGMLFGMTKQRGRASATDMYSIYEPWIHPAFYAGALKFESGGKIFRVERSFHKSQKENRLICESDGEELSIDHGDLEMLLGGLEASAFDNTMSIRQMKSTTDEKLALELKNYAANYHKSGDFELDLTEAFKALKAEKKVWQKRLKMGQEEQQKNREQIQTNINFVQAEIERGRDTLDGLREKEEILKEKEDLQRAPQIHRPFSILTGLAGAASFSIAVFLLISNIWLDFIFSIAGFAVLLLVYFKFSKKIKAGAELSEWQRVRWEIERLSEELKERTMSLENLKVSYQELEEVGSKVKGAEEELAALDLAESVIKKVSEDIRKEQGNQLNQKASDVLRTITEEKYQHMVIDEAFHIRINTPERLLELHQVSRGTIEQVYFALRMAASELLFPEEEIPVILDETFAFYDEKRVSQTLTWLSKNKKQVLLFTCQKRDEEILKKLGIAYHCPWE